MADVIAAYESAADTSDPEVVKAEFEPVLEACMQPIMSACQRSAEALALDAPSRSAIAPLGCVPPYHSLHA